METRSKILTVRDVDPEVFTEFKAEAVKEGVTVGKALTQAMEFWMNVPQRKPKRSISKFKATDWGKGTERLSEQIDEIIYGGE